MRVLLYWVKKQQWHVLWQLNLLLANITISERMCDGFFLWMLLVFTSQLRDLMEHADQTKDKDLIEVRKYQTMKLYPIESL